MRDIDSTGEAAVGASRRKIPRPDGRRPAGDGSTTRPGEGAIAAAWCGGEAQVEVTSDVDANGIRNVVATDEDTGAEQRITISESSNLDKSGVDLMVGDAERQMTERRWPADPTTHRVDATGAAVSAGAGSIGW